MDLRRPAEFAIDYVELRFGSYEYKHLISGK